MSKAPKPTKASLLPYPVWVFEVPVTATADLCTDTEITSVNAAAKLLLRAVENLIQMPSGGTTNTLDGVLLGRPLGQRGVDTALAKLTGPSSGSASASASARAVVSVVLLFGNEGRPRQGPVRTLSALVTKLLSGAPASAIEDATTHCTLSLRHLDIASLGNSLAHTMDVLHLCWRKTLLANTPSLRAGGAASLQAYMLGRHEAGAHGAGSADPVATASFHLDLGLDMLGPRESSAPWASSSSSSSASSKRAPLRLTQQGEGAQKKAREAPEAAPPAPATNPNQSAEPPANAEHSNAATNSLAELLSWDGALTGPTAAERARDILQLVAGVTDENARLKLELECYKAQDALRAKVSLAHRG